MAVVTSLGNQFDSVAGSHAVTATPAVGDLIVIAASSSDWIVPGTPPSDNNPDGSGSYSLVRMAFRRAGPLDSGFIWVRNALIGSASSTIFTYNPGATTGGGIDVFKVTGCSAAGLAAIRGSGQEDNIIAGNTPAPVLKNNAGTAQAALTTNPIIGIVIGGGNPETITPPSGFTESVDTGYTLPTEGIETCFISSGVTSSTITWGSTNVTGQHGSIVVEIETAPYLGQDWTPQPGPLPVFRAHRPITLPASPPAGTLAQQTLAVAATFTAAFVRVPTKLFAIAGTFTPAFQKVISRTLALALSAGMFLGKAISRTISTSSTMTAALIKRPNKVLAITTTFTTTLTAVKTALVTLAVNVTYTVSLIRTPAKLFAITTTFTVAMVKKVIRTFAVGATMTVALVKQVARPLALTATLTVAFVKKITRTLSPAVTFTVTLVTSSLRFLTMAVTSTFTTVLSKTPVKTLATSFTSALTMVATRIVGVSVAAREFIVRRQWTEGKRGGRWI